MRAAVYEEFQGPLKIQRTADPTPSRQGVVLQVKATGVCRSDRHGWMGYDPDISLPHVPGHEMSGVIAALGSDVTKWKTGDRVTLPFVCGCGVCDQCHSGNHHICDRQSQPGFTHWGSYADYVAIDYADVNLVELPEELDFVTAASLGCRFATSFRGIVAQGKVCEGQWVGVHGCGGVGLSAIMIASGLGAKVVAVDIDDDKLKFAESLGALHTINATGNPRLVELIKDITGGGAHLSVDALGDPTTCFNSVANLRKRGKHIQIGLMLGEHRHASVPMDQVVANELEIIGSHGMQACQYAPMLEMIRQGKLDPGKLIGTTVGLAEAARRFGSTLMSDRPGITVIDHFVVSNSGSEIEP